MIRDSATCKANHQRFISKIIENEIVWYLTNEEASASCESYDFDDTEVILFFSDRSYAKRVQSQSFDDYEVESMSLFDFLFRWLAGMAHDQVAAGTNWTGDLVGLEFDPQDLNEEIEADMGEVMYQNYLTELNRQIEAQNA